MLTVTQAAAQLGISKRQMYYLIERNELPHHKVTQHIIRIDPADLDRFKADTKHGGADGATR